MASCWAWVALAAGLVVAWLFDRRARRDGHRVKADIRKVNDERYRPDKDPDAPR